MGTLRGHLMDLSQGCTFAATHPGLDPWLYSVDADVGSFSIPSAFIPDGQRTVHRIDVDGTTAYRKWDAKARGTCFMDGARDKIAADLAQLVGAQVPSVLLWYDGFDSGCIQKEPPHFTVSLKSIVAACQVDPAGAEPVIGKLAACYDPMNVFFDVWLGNTDRFVNEGNVLICESSTAQMIWIIDFNCSLSHRERPWSAGHDDGHCLSPTEPPVPYLIAKRPELLQRLHKEADNLQNRLDQLDANIIDEICARAFGYYSSIGYDEAGGAIAACLKRRKPNIKSWTLELL